jgi:hypothetical protein
MSTGVTTPRGDTHSNSAVYAEPIGTIPRTSSTIPDKDLKLLSAMSKVTLQPSTATEFPLSNIATY